MVSEWYVGACARLLIRTAGDGRRIPLVSQAGGKTLGVAPIAKCPCLNVDNAAFHKHVRGKAVLAQLTCETLGVCACGRRSHLHAEKWPLALARGALRARTRRGLGLLRVRRRRACSSEARHLLLERWQP